MRILYLMDYFYGVAGGTERQVFELVTNLDQRICKPFLTVFRHMPYLDDHDFPCEVKVLGIHGIARPRTIAQLLVFAGYLRRNRIDLVHIFFNDAAIVAPLFCKLGGAKVISSRRDMGFWYTRGQIAALRFSNLFVDRIVANCKAVRGNVAAIENFPADRIEVIYNGHERDRFLQNSEYQLRERWNIGAQDEVIGMVSSLYELKRPQDLLMALRLILARHPAAVVVFVGGGQAEIDRVAGIAHAMGVRDRVRFIGRVTDPVPIIRQFDVCVLCSETEGLSNAIIEYMGCGKATVCTDAGGNAELIRDGYNGYVVPVGDTQALAERVAVLLERPDLRARLEANARASFADECFSTQGMVDHHMKLYTEIVLEG